jgi:hypothetical protein
MNLDSQNWRTVMAALDQELFDLGLRRELIVCGGGALLVLEIINRATRDLDILLPMIDPLLNEAAERVAQKLKLAPHWLNNGPSSLVPDLPSDWQSRLELIYRGKALVLKGLGRDEMLLTKIYAFCDREEDWQDLKKLKPTLTEIEQCHAWVLVRDASEYWPKRVEECFARLRTGALRNWKES